MTRYNFKPQDKCGADGQCHGDAMKCSDEKRCVENGVCKLKAGEGCTKSSDCATKSGCIFLGKCIHAELMTEVSCNPTNNSCVDGMCRNVVGVCASDEVGGD